MPLIPQYLLDQVEFVREPYLEQLTKAQGLSRDDYLARVRQKLKRSLEHSKILMRTPEIVVPFVFQDGRFRNLFEIMQHVDPSRDTTEYRRRRYAAEERMFGLEEETPAAERPLYGLPGDPSLDYNWQEYGAAVFVLGDSLRFRTTVTMACSIRVLDHLEFAPVPMTDPTEHALVFSRGDPLARGDDTLSLSLD